MFSSNEVLPLFIYYRNIFSFISYLTDHYYQAWRCNRPRYALWWLGRDQALNRDCSKVQDEYFQQLNQTWKLAGYVCMHFSLMKTEHTTPTLDSAAPCEEATRLHAVFVIILQWYSPKSWVIFYMHPVITIFSTESHELFWYLGGKRMLLKPTMRYSKVDDKNVAGYETTVKGVIWYS